MDIYLSAHRESMLRLREHLIAVEEEKLAGMKGISSNALDELIQKTIKEFYLDISNQNDNVA